MTEECLSERISIRIPKSLKDVLVKVKTVLKAIQNANRVEQFGNTYTTLPENISLLLDDLLNYEYDSEEALSCRYVTRITPEMKKLFNGQTSEIYRSYLKMLPLLVGCYKLGIDGPAINRNIQAAVVEKLKAKPKIHWKKKSMKFSLTIPVTRL